MPEWATKVKKHLKHYKIDNVIICEAQLRDYDSFEWYDPPLEKLPSSFSLVIYDGPPGGTNGGRYGLASILRNRLKPHSIILLDDAGREQERAIADRWAAEIGASFEILGRTKPW